MPDSIVDMFLKPVIDAQKVEFVPPPTHLCNLFSMFDPQCAKCPHGRLHYRNDECHTPENPNRCRGLAGFCVPIKITYV